MTVRRYNYDELIAALQEHFLDAGLPIPSWDAGEEERERFRFTVLKALAEGDFSIAEEDLQEVAAISTARMLGLGVLEPYLTMDGVEEIIVRKGHVQIYRYGSFHDLGNLASDAYFEALAHKVADFGGKELTAANPMTIVDIPGGARFACMIPPLSVEGTAINIRRFGVRKLTLDDLAEGPVVNPETGERTVPAFDTETRDFLARVAREMEMSVLISGKPGAGKTTLLNAFSAHLPPQAQVCVAETFRELDLACPHLARCVVTEAMEEGGRVTMSRAVNALYTRMRPHVLVLGEVVGPEAREYLTAINLGVVAHTTIHGNSALDALYRLETLALRPDVPLLAVQEGIARGVNLVVHLDLDPQGRRYMREMALVVGLEIKGEVGYYQLEIIKKRKGDGTYTPLPKEFL